MTLLLRTLVGAEGRGVLATPAFRSWLNGALEYPAASANSNGILLLDTRDPEFRTYVRGEKFALDTFESVLILARTRRSLWRPRQLLADVLWRRRARLPNNRLEEMLPAGRFHLTRLAFPDGEDPPAEFRTTGNPASTNAFLLTRRHPFRGGIWDFCSDQLGDRELSVNGFHLRARGPAVVDVTVGDDRLILRLVPDPQFHDIVSRNHASLMKMRDAFAGDDVLVNLLPRPVFASTVDGTLVLGEHFVPGTLAWKLARGSLGPVIRRGTLEFLERVRNATNKVLYLDDNSVAQLLSTDLERTNAAAFVPGDVRAALLEEFAFARRSLTGQTVGLYASHGDFGYGNVLVDPLTGALNGVIDWDTSRVEDLPGVDRINLEIQTWRTIEGGSFDQAARHVWNTSARPALCESGAPPALFRPLAGLAVCRYVTRLLSYPEIYAPKHAEITRALEWLRNIPG